MQTIYPYVISEAYPDYKRPWLNQIFGQITKDKIDSFFIEKSAEFILDRYNEEDIKNISDIENIWDNYYYDVYMENEPWQAMLFINDEWEDHTPTNEQIFNYIKNINYTEDNEKCKEKKTDECIKEDKINGTEENDTEENDTEENDTEENDDQEQYELSQEDIDTQNKMREYFEKEIGQDQEIITILQNMNQAEQLIFLLNKCIINIPQEKYNKNIELFNKFLNMISHFIEKDIDEIRNKLQVVHDEKEAERLGCLVNTYLSIIKYKNTIC